jgi:predicted alpha/beta-hydrolase family hydrolase
MASHAVAQGRVVCRGLIFGSFPLHAAKKPDRRRAAHLPDVSAPMLFLSGTRDDLARSDVLEDVVRELPHAQLHWLETGNHSYVVLKRTRTNPQPIFEEMADAARAFVDEVK